MSVESQPWFTPDGQPAYPLASDPRSSATRQSVRTYCPHRRVFIDPKTRKAMRVYPCGRWCCSRECRDSAANKWASILKHSLRTKPPSRVMRITPMTHLQYGARRKLLAKLIKRLRDLAVQYIWINEWTIRGVHHWNLLLRFAVGVDAKRLDARIREKARELFGKRRHYLKPPRDLDGCANYFTKNVRDDSKHARKKVMAPADWRGRMLGMSAGFLCAPKGEILESVGKVWTAKADAKAKAKLNRQAGHHPNADHSDRPKALSPWANEASLLGEAGAAPELSCGMSPVADSGTPGDEGAAGGAALDPDSSGEQQ